MVPHSLILVKNSYYKTTVRTQVDYSETTKRPDGASVVRGPHKFKYVKQSCQPRVASDELAKFCRHLTGD